MRLDLKNNINGHKYDAVIVAVNHRDYVEMKEEDFRRLMSDDTGVLMDVKGIYRGKIKDLKYWSL